MARGSMYQEKGSRERSWSWGNGVVQEMQAGASELSCRVQDFCDTMGRDLEWAFGGTGLGFRKTIGWRWGFWPLLFIERL